MKLHLSKLNLKQKWSLWKIVVLGSNVCGDSGKQETLSDFLMFVPRF